MFFNINYSEKDNFPNQYHIGNFVINTDNGWKIATITEKNVLYKGYADDAPIEDILEQIISSKIPEYTGNFCVFVYDNEKLHIKTDTYRGFPIYVNDTEITNLHPLDRSIPSDTLIYINSDLSIVEEKFDIIGELNDEQRNKEDVLDSIHQLLSNKIENFAKHNNLPTKAFLSGGVDSMLVYSYLSKFTDLELLDCEHFEFDKFYLKNSYNIKNLWAYRQMHHWKNPTLLSSGAPGDEFMLRSPTTANFYCIHHGTNIIELLSRPEYKNCLHYTYFNKPNHVDIFEKQLDKNNKTIINSAKYMKKLICNLIINDYQHHHLGNTITFTPLRDLRIMKLLLQLPYNDGVEQVMNSNISLELIKRNNPKLLNHLSKQKNSPNQRENLIDLILK